MKILFAIATPMIGTELLKQCQEQDLLREGFDVYTATISESYIKNPNISFEEIKMLCNQFNKNINKNLLWRNPIAFFRKYYKSMIQNPKGILNMFKKFS